jgi:hypothetical protein
MQTYGKANIMIWWLVHSILYSVDLNLFCSFYGLCTEQGYTRDLLAKPLFLLLRLTKRYFLDLPDSKKKDSKRRFLTYYWNWLKIDESYWLITYLYLLNYSNIISQIIILSNLLYLAFSRKPKTWNLMTNEQQVPVCRHLLPSNASSLRLCNEGILLQHTKKTN